MIGVQPQTTLAMLAGVVPETVKVTVVLVQMENTIVTVSLLPAGIVKPLLGRTVTLLEADHVRATLELLINVTTQLLDPVHGDV